MRLFLILPIITPFMCYLGQPLYKLGDGAIRGNVITASPEGPNSRYRRNCKKAGVDPHPAMFPEVLPERAIRHMTEERDIVMDPFCGSGTTLRAAERLNRQWIGTDISLKYLETIQYRFA